MTPGIRPAVQSDLDAIAGIAIAALPTDPAYEYRFPYINQYPEDFAKFNHTRYSEVLAGNDAVVMVYELPSIEDPSVTKPVAFSVWMFPQNDDNNSKNTNGQQTPTTQWSSSAAGLLQQRRDANLARTAALQADIEAAKRRLFDEPYGERGGYTYLGMLACHPDYQRRGAGRALLSWGLKYAAAARRTTTNESGGGRRLAAVALFASPAGAPLYRSFGFRDAGEVRTQIEGDEAFHDAKAMVLEL